MTMVGKANGLSVRHIRFIAIGGAIGSGLFLGSGEGIVRAGPALLLAYALAGGMVFFIARALGELTLNLPRDGSFTTYAHELIGPWCGFVTGWSYWLSWVLVCMADVTAAGIFMQFWIPDLPQWATALCAILALYGLNLLSVRLFGELEFWLAIIKVLAILALIVGGVVLIATGSANGGDAPGLSNLWNNGGLMPTGVMGFAAVLPVAFFAFGGVELIGITAQEAEKPNEAVPRAINSVILRILIFYIGSLTVIMALLPWTEIARGQSPFVLVFDRTGFPAAASALNLVVLSAVLSACNSGMFATGRVLTALSVHGDAPRWLSKKSSRDLPARSLSVSAAAMLGAVGLNYAAPSTLFGYLLAGSAVLLMWNWLVITVCHHRWRLLRKPHDAPGVFALPFYPVSSVLIATFISVVIGLMLTVLQMALPVLLAGGWFAALLLVYVVRSRFRTGGSGSTANAFHN